MVRLPITVKYKLKAKRREEETLGFQDYWEGFEKFVATHPAARDARLESAFECALRPEPISIAKVEFETNLTLWKVAPLTVRLRNSSKVRPHRRVVSADKLPAVPRRCKVQRCSAL